MTTMSTKSLPQPDDHRTWYYIDLDVALKPPFTVDHKITLFMGFKIRFQGYYNGVPKYYWERTDCDVPIIAFLLHETNVLTTETFYDENWDSLMPVVEKIESKGFNVTITTNSCSIKRNGTTHDIICVRKNENELRSIKMIMIYQACVQFVNFWFEQNETLKTFSSYNIDK